ncbi:unnamed protein product, partial [Rotaria sp. Silwood2]
KLAANLHIDETVTCAGGWTDEDDLNRENLNNKQDELAFTTLSSLLSLDTYLVRDWLDVHSPKLFYAAVGLKLEEFGGRLQIEYRLAKTEKFQDQE